MMGAFEWRAEAPQSETCYVRSPLTGTPVLVGRVTRASGDRWRAVSMGGKAKTDVIVNGIDEAKAYVEACWPDGPRPPVISARTIIPSSKFSASVPNPKRWGRYWARDPDDDAD